MLRHFSIPLGMLLCLCNLAVAADGSGLWLDVPFVKQEQNACGAASIAMVTQYWMLRPGRTVSPSSGAIQIQRTLYSGPAHGIYAFDLEHYLQPQGFRTFAF